MMQLISNLLSEDLKKYIHDLLGKDKKNAGLLKYILNTLSEAEPLFPTDQALTKPGQASTTVPITEKTKKEILKMDRQERILEIIKGFMNEFESYSLPSGSSIKNYVLFLLTIFRLSKKLKSSHDQGIILANALSRLGQMLAKYPLNYKSRAFREPLGLLFLVTEFAVRSAHEIQSTYKFEETTLLQFTSLIAKFCADSENPLREIIKAVSEMPKFRLDTKIGEDHKKIIKGFLEYCLPHIALKTRLDSAARLLARITADANDSDVLSHYNVLKLFFEKDRELRTHLSRMARVEWGRTNHRRFVNNILEELSALSG